MAAAYATALFSTAQSLLAQSALSSSYTLTTTTPTSLSSSSIQSTSTATPRSGPQVRTITIGPWKVDRAVHNSNGKVVSIWSCDKASLASGGRGGGGSTRRVERAAEVVRKEASSLSRLRHPCILEMAEPLEETRSTIMFATEPVSASLRHAITASSEQRRGGRAKDEDELELDEVEIQKGLSQLAKGLQFLHDSAKLVHGNLTPDSVIINAKGDWKLSGFGLSTYLFAPDGSPAKWEFPEYDHSLPSSCQRDYDYMAPEYLLDEADPSPSNDLYSLGCILHAIHTKGGPPFSHHASMSSARTQIEEGLSRGMVRSAWRKLPEEVQSVLSQLITRYPSSRLSASSFLAHPYFSSLLVSTLRFLERDSFAAQSSEAQASFLKGLVGVLPRFSDKVGRRKVLPTLLEETRKAGLVPFLLPNILYIGAKMDAESFRAEVLPQLKPLFAIKEPPQAVIALLDNLPLFLSKCTPAVFREEVMPLVYHALDSENPTVLERALRVVPGLSESLDYTTVKQTLFPKITAVFSRTTMLSVKVNTLICFHSMVKTLDKFTLTEKLVPLLAKIKTKEPAVMVATLAVHEALGYKCEIEAIATLILPQLWAMSMGPLLNAAQFAKFMNVIKSLGTRVEREHSAQLGELRRLEESSGSGKGVGGGDEVDFESLVRGGGGMATMGGKEDLWSDDALVATPAFSPSLSPNTYRSFSPAPIAPTFSSKAALQLGARPIPSSAFSSSSFPSSSLSSFPTLAIAPSPSPLSTYQAMAPSSSRPPAITNGSGSNYSAPPPLNQGYGSGRPNYDLSLSPQAPVTPQYVPRQQPDPTPAAVPTNVGWNNVAPPPGFGGGILTPMKVQQPKKPAGNFGDWADFDPLK